MAYAPRWPHVDNLRSVSSVKATSHPRSNRTTVGAVAVVVAVGAYGWWLTDLEPFSDAALATMLAFGLVLIAVAQTHRARRRRVDPATDRTHTPTHYAVRRSIAMWSVVVGLLLVWELSALFGRRATTTRPQLADRGVAGTSSDAPGAVCAVGMVRMDARIMAPRTVTLIGWAVVGAVLVAAHIASAVKGDRLLSGYALLRMAMRVRIVHVHGYRGLVVAGLALLRPRRPLSQLDGAGSAQR